MTVRAHVYVAKVSLQPRFIGKETRGIRKPMIPQASRDNIITVGAKRFMCVLPQTLFLTGCELVLVTARIS